MNIYFFNKFIIKIIPYSILFAFILIKIFDLSFYNSLSILAIVFFFISKVSIPSFRVKNYTNYILLFGLYVILSDVFIGKNFDFYRMIVKNRYLSFYCLCNIIENTKLKKEEILKMINPLFILIIISFIVILIQQIVNPSFLVRVENEKLNIESTKTEIRLFSIFTWASIGDLALYFVPISYLVTSYFLTKKKFNLAFLILILAVLTIFLSKSRGTLLAVVPMFFLFSSRILNLFKSKSILSFLILLVLISGPVYWLGTSLNFNSIIENRILESDKGNFEDKTAYTRIIAIQAFVKFFPEKPIFGAGNSKYGVGGTGSWNTNLENFLGGRSSQIHVGVLSLFYLYGIVGGIIYILFYYKLAKRFYSTSKRTLFWGTFWGIMVLPILNLSMDWLEPFSAGILLCIVFNKYLNDNISQESASSFA
ncbi:MAG: O-antigen ligase family protein [Bacteroidota bacterium]